jgi:uncharacterized protein YggU (UPF0235/DUF167 family)
MTRRFSLLKLSNAAAPFTFRARDSSAVIRFSVRVHAGSPTSRVGGDFNGALQVRVQSQAVDGAATNEVCAVLAHVFGVRPGAVQCVRGARSRTKLIAIEGDDDALADQLRTLLSLA